ncbi:hypothetical protein Tco_0427549 [Tanacetum coccineum]
MEGKNRRIMAQAVTWTRAFSLVAWGSPAGIHGLFSGWYCGLASRKVTLRVSMAWAKGITTGNHVEDVDVRKSG